MEPPLRPAAPNLVRLVREAQDQPTPALEWEHQTVFAQADAENTPFAQFQNVSIDRG